MSKQLKDISEYDFNELKKAGFLWEFFPEAPEFYYQIKK